VPTLRKLGVLEPLTMTTVRMPKWAFFAAEALALEAAAPSAPGRHPRLDAVLRELAADEELRAASEATHALAGVRAVLELLRERCAACR
jgi:hypothetical protein